MLSDWNKFVKKVYHAGKAKDPAYKFKNALQDASARKHEMNGGNAEATAPAEPSAPVEPSAHTVPGPVESSVANTAAPFKGGKSKKGGKTKKGGKKNKGTRKNKGK
jgi:hypothetical protein